LEFRKWWVAQLLQLLLLPLFFLFDFFIQFIGKYSVVYYSLD
jgi:hypothetical protein